MAFDAFSTGIYDDKLFHTLLKTLGLYILTGVVIMATEFGGMVVFGTVSESMTVKFRVEALRSILHEDGKYFDMPDHSPGKLITHLAGDAPKIRAAIDSRIFQISFGLSGMLASFILGFSECWEISVCGTGFILLYAALQIFLAMRIKSENIKLTKNDQSGKLSVEIIENVRTIQLLTREQIFNNRYFHTLDAFRKAEDRKGLVEALNFALSQSFKCFILTCSYSLLIHLMSIDRIPLMSGFKYVYFCLFSIL
uniref:ABC transmembrane type-1 domain-containing protein n=1 Tax=Syphacia muris TaxID=451379 RepID=A0A0N5ACI3_9BILA